MATGLSFNYKIISEFKAWLHDLGYAESTIDSFPIHVTQFLNCMAREGKSNPHSITSHDVKDFIALQLRTKCKNKFRYLSQSYINKRITAINLFSTYLFKTTGVMNELHHKQPVCERPHRSVLTKNEVDKLFQATDFSGNITYQSRDRAILSVFYGCGLRKKEGSMLNVEDLYLNHNIIHVRNGKNRSQRIVPITSQVKNHLEEYLKHGRLFFARLNRAACAPPSQALFVNQKGQRMNDGFYYRLKKLCKMAGINKEFGLHTLRHSIASHLLYAGMSLEGIAEFLGHTSLDSTQIYTHLVNEFLYESSYEF